MWFGSGVNQISVNPSELIVSANIRSVRSVVASNFVGDGGLISNIYFSNVSIPPLQWADIIGNLTGNSVSVDGNVSAGFFVGNGSRLTGLVVSNSSLPSTINADITGNLVGAAVSLTGNATAKNFVGNVVGNLTGSYAVLAGNATALNFVGNVVGNLTGSYAVLAGNATALNFVGNLTGGYASLSGNATALNFVGNVVGNLNGSYAVLAGNATALNFVGNVVGNLTGAYASLSGNLSANNATLTGGFSANNATLRGVLTGNVATFSGNVGASYFTGNGALLVGVTSTLPTTVPADLVGNVTGNTATLTGNATALNFVGNLTGVYASLAGNATAANFVGNLVGTTASLAGNATALNFVGNLTGVYAKLSGNLAASFVNATSVVAANAVLASGTTVANTEGLYTSMIYNTGYVYSDTFVIGNASNIVGYWRKSDGLLSTTTATVSGRLTVQGSGTEFSATKYFLSNPPGSASWTSISMTAQPISIQTSYGIYMSAGNFWSSSDSRKKFDVEEEDPERCAAAVRASRLVTYTSKDAPGRHMGFVAQQVANVVPGCVTLAEQAVPSVMLLANVVSPRSFALAGAASALAGGNVVGVRLMQRSGSTLDANITSISGDVVTIDGPSAIEGGDVFVYGPIVDDFNTLDYQRMWSVAFGAVQHLLSEHDASAGRLAALEARLGAVERRGWWRALGRFLRGLAPACFSS